MTLGLRSLVVAPSGAGPLAAVGSAVVGGSDCASGTVAGRGSGTAVVTTRGCGTAGHYPFGTQ